MQEATLPAYRTDYVVLRLFVRALLILTIILVFLPLNPLMPNVGGDYSWMFGMNQAVAQGLVFGKDIVFPLGPYAAVYTKTYHPNTDHLMLLGGLVLAIFHVILLGNLTKSKSVVWHVLFIGFFSAGLFSRDALMFLYPLLLALYVYQLTPEKANSPRLNFQTKATCAVLFFPFGLLFLIKGSLIILIAGITGMCAILFWLRDMKKLAITICIVPLISTFIFLKIANQPIIGLWYYLRNMTDVSKGYTEAMAVYGPKSELILFMVTSLTMLYFCYKANKPLVLRLFLSFSLALYLFTAFKAGFTRHDSHALTSAVALFIAGFLLHTVLHHRKLYVAFLLSALSWLFISYNYVGQLVFDIFKPIPVIYTESLDGLMLRLSGKGKLKQKYYDKLNEIRQQQPKIPLMAGTTDLYSYEQSYLLATENKWSPRPVIQSYAVYTAKLAEMNEAHLVSPTAPNNIIFRLQTIDNRIPALDDGLSWPTIINNYKPGNIDVGFLYLEQRRPKNITPKRIEIYRKTCRLNEEIMMPADTSRMLFAQFDINQTAIGECISALYQPEPMIIVMTLADGSKKIHRMIPGMSKSGFIFSPYIENVEEFASLFNDSTSLKSKVVKSFKISNEGLGFRSKFRSWKQEYIFSLSRIVYDN